MMLEVQLLFLYKNSLKLFHRKN